MRSPRIVSHAIKAVRVLSAVAIGYQLAFVVVLLRRQMARRLPMGFAWVVVVVGLNLLVLIAASFESLGDPGRTD